MIRPVIEGPAAGWGKGMLKLLLFDLDQTLVRTDDLKALREAGRGRNDPGYVAAVQQAFQPSGPRMLYSHTVLNQLRGTYPELRLGVFTRSPRAYALAILACAYPGFAWDVVVAFEDVTRTKPFRDGVWKAAEQLGIKYANEVAVVGDSDIDVCAAYHAGVLAVVDQRGWPAKREWDHWAALGHVPDAVIHTDDELVRFVAEPETFLPELEWRLAHPDGKRAGPRFDRINKFLPAAFGGTKKPWHVFAAGRLFAGYESLETRREWHGLTASIKESKVADTFPDAWVSAVSTFIRTQLAMELLFGRVVVTVIPHRPERPARLEQFLNQVAAAMKDHKAAQAGRLAFVPDLLAYKAGVKSQSGEHLSPTDRFANVRDHLHVSRPDLVVSGPTYVVIDDVTTTGSSLIYASRYLTEAGAGGVLLLALAMTVSNVLPQS